MRIQKLLITSLASILTIGCFSQTKEDYLKTAHDKEVHGDLSGAMADYSKAIEIDPKNKLAYFNRGDLKKRLLVDYKGAIDDFSKAIEIDPNYTSAYYYRGETKKLTSDYRGAKECLDFLLSRRCKVYVE